MRIRKIPGTVNLVGFYLAQQFHSYADILFAHRFLLNCTGFIKWQVLKMNVVVRQTDVMAGGPCFAAAYQSFYAPDLGGVSLTVPLIGQETGAIFQYLKGLAAVTADKLFKPNGKIQEPRNKFIRNRNIA